ncbi:pyridoxal-phosphate dependent enzyme [Streptomyces sp. NPDC014735]|uniref:pyridoxal-phosphate dependent enzyme n=1 Tax=unclassified Streptomyces TaxID=2593676 RepID=UPI00093E78A9|nr:pyridoxal-phosphate dependent enzyme [Streptomyces sp. CB01580]
MTPVQPVLARAIHRTPLLLLDVAHRGRVRRLGLKLEEHGPTGSVKDRSAVALLRALHDERPLTPGTVVVESTSGNLGLALARLLPAIDCVFLAVVDLKTPHTTLRTLTERGARTIVVDEPDGQGGYLLTRLRTVRELCARHPAYRWPNQYENPAAPDMHRRTTGPEITEQAGPLLGAVYVPVSTGGTLAGIGAHLRQRRPDVAVVAVDVTGSTAVSGSTGRRLIPGIGASRPSALLKGPDSYDRAVRVDDIEAIAVCRILAEDTGLVLGGSSGCAVRALLSDQDDGHADDRIAVCLAADGGVKYRDTLYSDDWAGERGIVKEIAAAMERLRREGLFFDRKHQEH